MQSYNESVCSYEDNELIDSILEFRRICLKFNVITRLDAQRAIFKPYYLKINKAILFFMLIYMLITTLL